MSNLKQDIRIDESALDIEALRQSELMKTYTEEEADAKNELDRAEEAVDILHVKLDKEIRQDPDKFDVEKITETVVLNTIKNNEEYQEARKAVLDARHDLNNAKSAVRSIEVKKSMIETLVKLHGQSYFAGPSVPRDLTAERQQERSNEKVTINRTKKKKKKK